MEWIKGIDGVIPTKPKDLIEITEKKRDLLIKFPTIFDVKKYPYIYHIEKTLSKLDGDNADFFNSQYSKSTCITNNHARIWLYYNDSKFWDDYLKYDGSYRKHHWVYKLTYRAKANLDCYTEQGVHIYMKKDKKIDLTGIKCLKDFDCKSTVLQEFVIFDSNLFTKLSDVTEDAKVRRVSVYSDTGIQLKSYDMFLVNFRGKKSEWENS